MPPFFVRRQQHPTLVWPLMFVLCAAVATGCKDLTGNPGLPAGTPDPSTYNNAAGAIGMRNSAIASMEGALAQYMMESGLLTDEFTDYRIGASTGSLLQNGQTIDDPLDERVLPVGIDQTGTAYTGATSYADLQQSRSSDILALGALAAYDTASTGLAAQRVMRGELFALQADAEILLADLFCSGVPLSTIDFQGDFTYAPSSTSVQVYRDALVKLDSAATVGAASDSLLNLVSVLRGRAYLDLGIYDSAATAVASVSPSFQYMLAVPLNATGEDILNAFTVADHEGGNGLPFRSSQDPRTASVATCIPPQNYPYCPVDTLYFPAKYSDAINGTRMGYAPFVVADGIEAQLIVAESQLQPASAPAGAWLTTLNTLRGTIQLSDTSDPGTAEGRVSLLLHERAYWLFATGHRQGDLRRALRQYRTVPGFQSQSQLYPTGTYTALGTGRYGTDINAPIPTAESANPDFHGCLDRNP